VISRSRTRLAAAFALLAALVTGCANFTSEAAPASWSPTPTLVPENAPAPAQPGANGGTGGSGSGSSGGGGTPTSVPPPQGCKDFNPDVIATCLDTVTAVAVLPGSTTDPVVLAAQRDGQIVKVHDQVTTPVASVAVDGTGDGGLTGLAISPSYVTDQLIFAYITTPTDNRVVRIAAGQAPKPILTGIPRGASGNHGALALDHTGALLVATGDAGNPALAANPASLAGKVLRIDVDGTAAQGNPAAGSAVIASGLADPGGVCGSLDGSTLWVTDRTTTADALYRIHPGQPLGTAAWNWPDKPGVAGCAAFTGSVMVVTSTAGNVQTIALNVDGSFNGTPQVGMTGSQGFGKLAGVDILSASSAVAGTVNKANGTPVSSDDRVVIISGAAATGPGRD